MCLLTKLRPTRLLDLFPPLFDVVFLTKFVGALTFLFGCTDNMVLFVIAKASLVLEVVGVVLVSSFSLVNKIQWLDVMLF